MLKVGKHDQMCKQLQHIHNILFIHQGDCWGEHIRIAVGEAGPAIQWLVDLLKEAEAHLEEYADILLSAYDGNEWATPEDMGNHMMVRSILDNIKQLPSF